jgi:hypothetical protein
VTTAAASSAKTQDKPAKQVIYRNGKKPEKPPLFNGTVVFAYTEKRMFSEALSRVEASRSATSDESQTVSRNR